MMYGGGGFLWLIILVLAVAAIYYFISHAQKTKPAEKPPSESPLDIIKKRYARGEISREEFERLKSDLSNTP